MLKRRITVVCPNRHGVTELTSEQYGQQLARPDSLWACPICNRDASWNGIEYQCPHCQAWVEEDCECECGICMFCSNKGAPDLPDGQCPICGAKHQERIE